MNRIVHGFTGMSVLKILDLFRQEKYDVLPAI